MFFIILVVIGIFVLEVDFLLRFLDNFRDVKIVLVY